jgi:hypothetical protein
MLGKLFGSKSRVKILKLFLLNPNEKYYIRQISRDLKLQLNSVRRELENLEKFGILTSNPEITLKEEDEEESDFAQYITSANKSVGKKKQKVDAISKVDKKYFKVNTNFVLYEEIKALIIKAQILYEKDFVNKIHKTGRPKLLIFCGFFVNKEDSQVDILLVGRFSKPKLLKLIKELETDLGREVNFTIMDYQEFKYRRDITDVFIYDILENKNLTVIDEIGI